MPRLRLFHWNAEEAAPLIELLRAAGYTVDYDEKNEPALMRSLRETPLHAVVIDLTRMPSHGRYLASGIRQTKSTRRLPIVFVDGDPAKVELIRAALPDAIYTSRSRLAAALKRVKPLADPVVPVSMMNSYGSRTLVEKLGIAKDKRVALIDPPPGYAKAIGKLPPGASLEEDPGEVLPITLWFVRDFETYLASLPRMRSITPPTRLWILWPKGKASALNGSQIREAAIAMGLVDYKICSFSETWSAMLFAKKKA